MNNQWQIDFFTGLDNAVDMQDVLDITQKTIKPFGFDFCGWRSKIPLPLSNNRRFSTLRANEDRVSEQEENGFYDEAPVAKHCALSTEPISWRGTTEDPTFLQAPDLISEYYSSGHYGGWAQSMIESKNVFSMLLVDSVNILDQKDIDHVDLQMQWVATAVLSKMTKFRLKPNVRLSEREKEVLRWSGDGKTAWEISQILNLSQSTVNFHMRSAMYKLDAPNKTNALVKAIYLGLLY
ncbi:LuxR C-terminal-related transcriptional regulator [Zymobacter palmae]|uniref:DNA-binding HTH domain-containing proteins n=1 Tax=Zymobacter palmae TaxID=33074 RepID=A0A348HFG2_9GAMM|nr:LuxR C-terminal-related transcriptional regulator [Zymobacter palmae]BBG30364.1 DNA-binding HTH domain-containing proteins [Zymobacter palmae]